MDTSTRYPKHFLTIGAVLAVKVQKETRSSLRHSIPATIPETSNLADQDDTEILPSPPLRQTNLDGQLESEEDDDVENETFANYQIPQAENRRQTGPKITTAQKEFSNQVEQARLLHGREEDLVRRVSMGIGFADRFEDLPADLGRRLTRNSFGSLREDVGVDSSIMMDESVMERTYGGGDESLDITGDFTAPRLSMGAEELLAGEEFDDSLEVTEQFSGDKRRDTVTQFDFMPEHDQVEDVAEDVEMENAEQTAEVFEKKKATPRKRNKVEGAYLPEGVIKKLVSRLGYKNLSKETLAALREASKQFLEQASEDLDAYAAHANRKTITADDMHQLLRR